MTIKHLHHTSIHHEVDRKRHCGYCVYSHLLSTWTLVYPKYRSKSRLVQSRVQVLQIDRNQEHQTEDNCNTRKMIEF